MTQVDAIIIGTGQAGPPLAGRLTAAGQRVVIVERELFGGTCVNTGCTPTKTLVASAYAAHLARRAADYGVVIDGAVRVDMAAVKARADKVSGDSRRGVEKWLRGMERCTVVQGHARFEDARTIRVGDETYTAPQHLRQRRRPRARAGPAGRARRARSSPTRRCWRCSEVPRHLVIVGGSYIGLEFAQMYRRFGAEVTVVEMGPRLIGARGRRDLGRDHGPSSRPKASRCGPARRASAWRVTTRAWRCNSIATNGPPVAVGSHVLLAVGRQPNTDDLGLDRAGVATDDRGYITVDDTLHTNVPGIWALGDCNGRGAFTHTSYNDFEIVAANLLDGETRSLPERIPAYALYIDPPLGRVGMTEAEARRSGRPLLVGRRPMTRVSRAIEKGETQGLMKVVADAETRKILGAAILGRRRRRGHPRRHRHHAGRRDMRRPAACRAHPPDGVGVDPDGDRRPETGVNRT